MLAGGVKNDNIDQAGGWAGMIAAALAFWLASLEIINDVLGGEFNTSFVAPTVCTDDTKSIFTSGGKELISPGHWPWTRKSYHGGAFHAAGRIHAPHHHTALYGAGFEEKRSTGLFIYRQ